MEKNNFVLPNASDGKASVFLPLSESQFYYFPAETVENFLFKQN